ncbi:unnamed protein product [Periconia digitata]|uniref:Uncharacterized protein n=1 Tax=Periconia digitata TaxID=1303443 RepID=A0A9W4XKN3_9PLEO|nr:unnamed protein product [Periconia digitata]
MSSSKSNTQRVLRSTQGQDPSLYRRIDYCDGQNIRVVETRRRQKMVECTTSLPTRRNPSSRRSCSSSSSAMPNTSQPVSSSPSMNCREVKEKSTLGDHVTLSQSHTKAVVIQSFHPSKGSKSSTSTPGDVGGLMTPPSTPRLERLPTPDLDDLEQNPFCDCCVGMRTIKYCASCGHDLDISR